MRSFLIQLGQDSFASTWKLMGYSNSPKAIVKLHSYLDTMLKCEDNEVSWITNNPRTFAYQLLNALKAAENTQDEQYKSLRSKWKIKFDNTMVIAQKKLDTLATLDYPKAIDAFDVIDVVAKLNVRAFPIVFPNAMRDEDSLLTLYSWSKNYKLGLILGAESGIIIVDIINEHCWKPPKD